MQFYKALFVQDNPFWDLGMCSRESLPLLKKQGTKPTVKDQITQVTNFSFHVTVDKIMKYWPNFFRMGSQEFDDFSKNKWFYFATIPFYLPPQFFVSTQMEKSICKQKIISFFFCQICPRKQIVCAEITQDL